MMKQIYILLLSLIAASVGAQNDNNFGNIGLTNFGNTANAPVIQGQYNPANQQVSFKQVSLENNNGAKSGNKFNDDDSPEQSLNNSDDHVNAPVQQQSVNQSKSADHEGLSFSLPKPAMGFGGSSSKSSGRNHSRNFSKKIKKFNRRMSYVFAKKQKKSYTVDFCFAWAK